MVLTTTFLLRQPHEYLFVNFLLIFKQMKHKYDFRGHINRKKSKESRVEQPRETMLQNLCPSDQRVEEKKREPQMN